MKKISRRTVTVLILCGVILFLLAVFFVKFAKDGERWASFYANGTVYSDGELTRGIVQDRNGRILSQYTEGYRVYHDDYWVRCSTLHAVGDLYGNIGNGVLHTLTGKLMGYNFISGVHGNFGRGQTVTLSLDGELCAAALQALDGRKGTVAVCNTKTGEILCMVSSPTFDPMGDGSDIEEDSGVYMNRFLSGCYTPGSIFKIVTLCAAIENIPDLFEQTFECDGECLVDGETLQCNGTHGTQTIEEAFAFSCNCAFAELAQELGPDILEKYAEEMGLLEAFTIDGLRTASGSFEKAKSEINVAWSGIGQYNDTVCPAAYLRLMTAIARGGESADLTMIHKISGLAGMLADVGGRTEKIRIKSTTADTLRRMMNYNVEINYGTENFPGLTVCAKSGTAELGPEEDAHAWFVGFTTDEDCPLAFTVIVENGGSGSAVAGAIASTVLEKAAEIQSEQ